MATTRIEVSATEMKEFLRLVVFVGEVENHAEENDDYDLLALVDDCRDDLLDAKGTDE